LIEGNLTIKGGSVDEVLVRASSPEDLKVDQDGDDIRIECKSDCQIRAPLESEVEIEKVEGDVNLKAIQGQVSVAIIEGNLTLKNTGPVQIDTVSGNLTGKHIDGDLTLAKVEGNVTVKDLEGSFLVGGEIYGNLNLIDIEESTVAKTNGNLSLQIDPLLGQSYSFEAGGNITCRLPRDASVQIKVEQAANLSVRVKGANIPSNVQAPFEVTLGDGDAQMEFSAGGNVNIVGKTSEWESMEDIDFEGSEDYEQLAEDITEQVTEQIESQMEFFEQQLEEHLSDLNEGLGRAGLSEEAAERITEKAREARTRASARVVERMQNARERIQRKMEAAQRRAEQRAREAERRAKEAERRARSWDKSWGFTWPSEPPAPAAPASGASEEERLLILQMLQEKKITAEEADKLLEALEGK
jgi:hypothetical protein